MVPNLGPSSSMSSTPQRYPVFLFINFLLLNQYIKQIFLWNCKHLQLVPNFPDVRQSSRLPASIVGQEQLLRFQNQSFYPSMKWTFHQDLVKAFHQPIRNLCFFNFHHEVLAQKSFWLLKNQSGSNSVSTVFYIITTQISQWNHLDLICLQF